MRRTKGLLIWVAVLVCAGACAPKATPRTAAANPPSTSEASNGTAALDELPAGPGRRVLTSACTQCHGLREVTKFRGFYGRAQWRDIVMTMVDYGASIDEKQVEVLTDYLTEQLGKK